MLALQMLDAMNVLPGTPLDTRLLEWCLQSQVKMFIYIYVQFVMEQPL